MMSIFGCSQGIKLERYETKDPEIGVSMLYPKGWSHSEDRGSGEKYYKVVFIEPKDTAGRKLFCIISVSAVKKSDMPGSIRRLSDAAEDQLAKFGKMKDFRLLAKKETKVAGEKAVDATYYYMLPDMPILVEEKFIGVKERAVILEKGDKFYFIRMFCQEDIYASLNGMFGRVLKSIKFLPKE
ncbi:MAG TPA: hypothetical protein PLA52_04355 [Candidatus Omnitrophota bacterium]|nr:hypothetical protein [Candidatus Omnitrophota bacterium]HRZ67784.1 hypothetical protein [Candidatus Omnitrophota bacterium]